MSIYLFSFSPTGGTLRVGTIVAEKLSTTYETIDLMDRHFDFSKLSLSKEDICVIAAPAFGGRVPETAISRLSKISGNQAKAILVAVYGNREFDDTLLELHDAALQAGFRPYGGIGAVAEHSLVRQFGAGRPDEEDQTELEAFALQLLKECEQEEKETLTLPGNRPYKEYKGSAIKPAVSETCIQCGLCAEKCPVGAIPVDAPQTTDVTACISCMACVAACPIKARKLPAGMEEALAEKLGPLCQGRKPNTLYL